MAASLCKLRTASLVQRKFKFIRYLTTTVLLGHPLNAFHFGNGLIEYANAISLQLPQDSNLYTRQICRLKAACEQI